MAKNYLKLIGARMRELRKDQDLTQEDIAEKADLNPNYYGRIERGEINVTIETLSKIAQALKVQISTFFVFEEPRAKPESEKEIRSKLKRLVDKKKPEELQTLSAIAQVLFTSRS
jgi:transcriptional regulator with XRE-family HTH domain